MKSKARREIDKWVKNAEKKAPVFLATGQVFLYPPISPSDTQQAYTVTWLRRQTPKRVFEEFTCSCTPWYYSPTDECRHVRDLKEQIAKQKEVNDAEV
jgi:hypothetical protein